MRIALIHLGRKGGGPPYILDLAKALHARGEEVCVFLSSQVENRNIFEQQDFKTCFFDTYNNTIEFVWSIFSFYKIERVVKSIRNYAPDAICSTLFHTWDPFLFPRLKGMTRIKTLHDVETHVGAGFFIRWCDKKKFSDAEGFVVLSNKYVNILEENRIRRENITVIPHAGYTYYSELSTNDDKKNDSNIRLLFFGRIEKYKGLGLLLKALEIILGKHPEVKLRIAGSGNIEEYSDMITKLQDNIELYNTWIKDEEVGNYLANCDLMVLPYIHATQSGVIPLAYAFSIPVIATNVGCLNEQIEDGYTGFLTNEVTPQGLANTILYAIENTDLVKIGQNANKYMKENLTWESSAEKLIAFIHKLKV